VMEGGGRVYIGAGKPRGSPVLCSGRVASHIPEGHR
jgi:hypothetical protein